MKRKIITGIIILITLCCSFNVSPAPALADAALAVSPNTGGSGMLITISGSGFAANTGGTVWFDTNGNGAKDSGEPQVSITTDANGAIPVGVNMTAPLTLAVSTTYYVRADIPEGGSVEASAAFATGSTTTAVTINRYDAHGNLTATQTVSYLWMEANLPVIGDGTTHYYLNEWIHNAATWDQIWDPNETNDDPAVLLDMGSPRGTDLKDLCNLVGTAAGDKVVITATDSFSKEFDYENIYHPQPRQGKMVISWWNGDQNGYVPGYAKGLRLLFFAETTNAAGNHIFGNWDMHETMPPAYWGYTSGPETGNPSVSNVCRIDIYAPNLISCDAAGNTKEYFAPGDTVYVKGAGLSANTNYNLWIQPDPVLVDKLNSLDLHTGAAYLLTTANDPSGSQETVTTNGTGDFAPVAIWTNCTAGNSYRKYDIVADNQVGGIKGYYDSFDGCDSPGFAGFSVVQSLPEAAFTATVTTGSYPFTAHFSDQSSGNATMTYAWDFDGSGTVESTDHNPLYTYNTPGTYTVKLRVTDGGLSDEELKTGYIVVTEPQAPVADFAADVTSGTAPLTVHFTDDSTNTPTSWAWDFNGDGVIDSSLQNPSHTYTAGGTYTVALTVTNTLGNDTETKTSYVTVTIASSQPVWDLNNDHHCNIGDVVKIGLKWGMTGTAGWIPEDVNLDGRINIGDVVVIGLHWGQTW